MKANSRQIFSAQTETHRHLHQVVAKHASTAFRKPFMPYNIAAFETSIQAWRAAGSPPLILDAGCGVGRSTLHLATRFPDHFVIGVDQSADRLSRHIAWDGDRPSNCIRVRADLVDYWRLLLAAGIHPVRHYVLYPNPWPKIDQLARRWHGHPVFPAFIELGGVFECRSNWRIYIEECAAALAQLTGKTVSCAAFTTETPITPFEEKYLASGHALWHCAIDLDAS
jgi:tRNA G46 methylase TrmB